MKDRSNYLPVAATAIGCSLAALYYYVLSNKKRDELANGEVKVDLLPIERTLAGGGGGDNAMSTFTWLQGEDPSEALRQRTESVLRANPWLAGRVRKHKGIHALVYSTNTPTSLDEYFKVTPNVLSSRNIPMSELGTQLADQLLKTGPAEPLWKVSIFPSTSTKHFAVVVSMSHVIGDGATFFKIQNMLLDKSTRIESLLLTRIASTEEQQIQAMGGAEEYGILSSAGFIVNCIAGVLKTVCNKKKYAASSRIYLVDKQGMEKTKKEASKQDDDTSFVSSNDVLVSWFFQNCNCWHGLMALNFRGRLAGHTDQHAGNYENVIFYRHEDSASPAWIRKSLSCDKKYQRQVTREEPMPSFYQMATASHAICSNWASFAKPCNVEGCTEEIQIPLYNVEALLPSTMAICMVFRAGPKGLAVLVAGAPDKLEGLEKTVPFLKESEVV